MTEVKNASTSTERTSNNLNCSVCSIDLPDETDLRQHLISQKHKKAYRNLEELQRINKNCGLYIKGFPHTCKLEDLLTYFQPYGNIVWVHMGVGFLLLDFEEPESARNVLNKQQHFFKGRKMYINRREYKEPKVQKFEDTETIINMLKDFDDLQHQLDVLKSYLQVNLDSNYQIYSRVHQDLYMTLVEYFPYCQIHPFGSTVTGLCFKNSDVDVFISGIKTPEEDVVPYLYRVKEVLTRSRRFTNILVIAHAKIPIVKCCHKETHTSCDINMKNMLGVCNSRLIKYYVDLNVKIKDLVIVLKYWAKVHKITGQNHLLTNYSLYLLVIFLLQQEPYNLPPVSCLQRDQRFYNGQDCWNGGFKELFLFRASKESLSKTNVLQLLKEFFEFYSDFDYSNSIICPYLGKPIKKELFKTPEELPHDYRAYKEFIKFPDNNPLKTESCICLQDPFEHSRNATSVILNGVLDKFVKFCQLGKKICKDGAKNLFYKLFTEDLQFEKKISQISSSVGVVTIKIDMTRNQKYFQKKIHELMSNSDRVVAEQIVWFDSVKEFIKIIFTDVLDFEVHEGTEETPAKSMKENGQSSVHDNQNFHLRCSSKLNVWDGRKNAWKKINTEELDKKKFIEKEIAITECIKSSCGFTPTLDILVLDIDLKFCMDPASAEISIKKVSCYKNTFRSFCGFITSKLKIWFGQYEAMLNSE